MTHWPFREQNVNEISWDLANESAWKRADSSLLTRVRREPQVRLRASVLDIPQEERVLEAQLRKSIADYRDQEGVRVVVVFVWRFPRAASDRGPLVAQLSVSWDDRLSYMLTPALVSYEAELTLQHPSASPLLGSDDFAEALKHSVPQHHSFKVR